VLCRGRDIWPNNCCARARVRVNCLAVSLPVFVFGGFFLFQFEVTRRLHDCLDSLLERPRALECVCSYGSPFLHSIESFR
jgi:hypothetical protein